MASLLPLPPGLERPAMGRQHTGGHNEGARHLQALVVQELAESNGYVVTLLLVPKLRQG